jgi:chitodextrinase
MARRNEKFLACAAIVLSLSFVMTGFIPVVSSSGWFRSIVIDTGLLFTQIGAGDADRDGHNELYVATMKGRLFKVYHAGNAWKKDELPSVPDSVQAMVVDDLTGDGFPEIYVASQQSTDNGRIYRISFNGATWSSDIIYKGFASSDYPMALATGDANHDGTKDLYWTEAGGSMRYAYLTGSGWVVNKIDTRPAGYLRCLTVGDGDGNGPSEIYVGTSDDRVLKYSYSGWNWQSVEIGYGGYSGYWDFIRDIIIGDPRNESRPEVIAAAGDRYIMGFRYDAFAGKWNSEIIYNTSEISTVNKLALGDANADDAEELFAAAANNTIYYYPFDHDLQKWNRGDVSQGPLPAQAMSLVVSEADDEPTYREIYVPCEDGKVYRFARDVDPPPTPLLWSPTHPEKTWRNLTVVKMEWSIGPDRSGIQGYSYQFNVGPGALNPDSVIDLPGTVTTTESLTFADSNEIYFSIMAMDGAGNWGHPAYYGPIWIDSTPPDLVALTINDGAQYSKTSFVNLGISAHDALSGLLNMSFSNDLIHWSDWVPYQATFSGWDLDKNSPSIGDGNRTVYARVQDNAGNVGPIAQSNITLQRTAPGGVGITINNGQRYTRSTDVDLKLTWDQAATGAKVTVMSFSNDDNTWSPWEKVGATRSHWSLVNDAGGWAEDGEHKVYFRVMDEAGNIGGPAHAPVVLDRTPPSDLSIIVNNGQLITRDTTVPLNLRATDRPEQAGLGYMYFREEGGQATVWYDWATKSTFVISSSQGTKIIYFKAKDKAGNEADAVRGYVVYDTAAPRISHVRVLGVSDKGAVVTWVTDIPANSVVRYGTTVNYNNAPFNSELVTIHSITLSGLRPSTEYHFQVNSTNAPGSYSVSKDYLFTTKELPDNIPPTITEVSVEGVTATTAVISWRTDEPSDTRLRYGTTTDYMFVEGDSRDALDHRVVLKGLTLDTKYFFMVQSSDSHGNGPSQEAGAFQTSTTYDTVAPTISNLKVEGVTDTLAIVEWYTNEPALSIIEYGTTSSYGQIAVSERYETSHRVVLTGLKPDTMYTLIVRAIDVVGNGPTTSNDLGFFTLKVPDRTPPVITNVKVEEVEATRAIISWATDEPSDSGVAYHTGTSLGQTIYDMDLVESHSMALGGLSPDKVYNFTVESMDASGNGPTISSEYSFRTGTLADNSAPGIFNVTVKGITNTAAVILWDTDKQAKCFVDYGKASKAYTFQVPEEGYHQDHTLVLWNLAPQTTYYLRLQCTDAAGHGPTVGSEINFATSNLPDKTPPKITDLKIWNITADGATIQWKTDEPADSEVRFKKAGQPEMVAREKRYVFDHLIVLQGLQSNSSYNFTVYSTDPSGNQVSGQQLDFTTKAPYVPPPYKPPNKPPPGGGHTTSISDAMPWIALALILMLVLGLTGFMYRQGLLKFGGDTSAVTSTTPKTLGGTSSSTEAPVEAILVGTDEGLCPHCHGHISLSGAASELSKERARDDERQRQEEAERKRQEAAEAQKKRIEDQARRAQPMAGTGSRPQRAPPAPIATEGTFEEVPLEGQSADELDELYQEVEKEKAQHAHRKPAHHAGAVSHAAHAKPVGEAQTAVTGGEPLKTVKCGHCGGRVPVYTEARPVRITCPNCKKSGTLKGR